MPTPENSEYLHKNFLLTAISEKAQLVVPCIRFVLEFLAILIVEANQEYCSWNKFDTQIPSAFFRLSSL
jgi:hypothetical protein